MVRLRRVTPQIRMGNFSQHFRRGNAMSDERRATGDVISEIELFDPELHDWQRLRDLVTELAESNDPHAGVDCLIGIFERFPDDEGEGVLWLIVHALESMGGYEPSLLKSVSRAPNEMSLLMVGRLMNNNVWDVDGVSLPGLLEHVATDSVYSPAQRAAASRWLERAKSADCNPRA